MHKTWFALVGAGVAAAVACSSNPTGNGNGCGGNGANVLVITASDNKTFTPQNAQGTVGQQICFQNLGTVLHTVTPDSLVPGDSTWMRTGEQGLPPNSPYQLSLGVGDYYYHCHIHGGTETGMWGKISIR